MNTERKDASLLVAEITGIEQLTDKLGAAEASRAIERAISRAERSVEAYAGQRLIDPQNLANNQLMAHFARNERAALAANDLVKRINQLPPVSGVSLSARVVLHAVHVDSGNQLDYDDKDAALKMLAFASAGQILASGDAVEKFSEGVRNNIISSTQLAGSIGTPDMPLMELEASTLKSLHAQDPLTVAPAQATIMPSAAPSPRHSTQSNSTRSRLLLRYQGTSLLVSEYKPVLLAGREQANDIIITDRRASRQHSRIEWRNGRFVLIDTSTNGTFLVNEKNVEILLKQSECDLPPRGKIGCGYSPLEIGCDPIVFDIGEKQKNQ